MIGLIVALICIVVMVIILIVVVVKLELKVKEKDDEVEKLALRLDKQMVKNEELEEKNKEVVERESWLWDRNTQLLASVGELEKRVEKEGNLEDLCQKITSKEAALLEVEERIKDANEKLVELIKVSGENEKFIEGFKREKELIEAQKIKIRGDLDSLLASWRAASLVDSGGQLKSWDIGADLTAKEKRLIALIGELKELYPDLAAEFAAVEWKRVWMPRFQNIVKSDGIDKKGGIYLLERKEEGEEGFGYVGQAQCFKDRWYQHCKKMIGVEGKGNEKVYKFRPEDFRWCILEEIREEEWKKVEGKGFVNERERFWIEAKGRLNS